MKVLIIFNSFSGNKRKHKKIEYIKNEISKIYDDMDFFSSFEVGSITKKIKLEGMNYDTILTLGGDGTIHEVINAIMLLDKRPALAVIPFGTCNDFSKNFTYNKINKAINVIKNNHKELISLTKINDTYMTYAMAFGCATEISYNIPSSLKHKFLGFAYYIYAFKYLFRPIINNKKCFIGILTKSNYLAGLRLRNKTNLYTDTFNYKLFNNKLRILGFIRFFSYIALNIGTKEEKDKLSINFLNETRINIDGEAAFVTKELNISIEKDALYIISKNYKKK